MQFCFQLENRSTFCFEKKSHAKHPTPISIYFNSLNWTNTGSPSDIIGFRLQQYGSMKSEQIGYIFFTTFSMLWIFALILVFNTVPIRSISAVLLFIVQSMLSALRFIHLLSPRYCSTLDDLQSPVYLYFCFRCEFLQFSAFLFLHCRLVEVTSIVIDVVAIPQKFRLHKIPLVQHKIIKNRAHVFTPSRVTIYFSFSKHRLWRSRSFPVRVIYGFSKHVAALFILHSNSYSLCLLTRCLRNFSSHTRLLFHSDT